MKRFVVLALAVGCGTPTQSARTLPEGTYTVTLATGRTIADGDGIDESAWSGNLSVRYGVTKRFDAGLHVGRTPSSSSSIALYAFEPKLLLIGVESHGDYEWHARKDKTFMSLGLPIGIVARDQRGDMDNRGLFIAPTLYLGHQITPWAEVVFAPKVVITIPHANGLGENNEANVGGSLGLRFTDALRTWAIHPEVGYLRFSEGESATSLFTIGIGFSAGN